MKLLCRLPLLVLLIFLSNEVPAQGSSQKSIAPCDSSSVVNSITELIATNLDTIKAEYYKINAFKDYPFQTASLFILSGVLLNDWQLALMKDRTEHKDSISFTDFSRDSSIYKNRIENIGKYYFGLYGRYTEQTCFITIDKNQLGNIFQISVSESLVREKENLLDDLMRYSKDENFFLPENKIAGFNELGLMQREIVSIPILTKKDYNSLYNVSSIITYDLIKITEKCLGKRPSNNDSSSANDYINSYKRLSAQVTEKLIELGYIKIPGPRNFNYIIVD